jgi:hypothetical protein
MLLYSILYIYKGVTGWGGRGGNVSKSVMFCFLILSDIRTPEPSKRYCIARSKKEQRHVADNLVKIKMITCRGQPRFGLLQGCQSDATRFGLGFCVANVSPYQLVSVYSGKIILDDMTVSLRQLCKILRNRG